MAYRKIEKETSCMNNPFVTCDNYNQCIRCAWNPEEDERRRDEIARRGLQKKGNTRFLNLRKISLMKNRKGG